MWPCNSCLCVIFFKYVNPNSSLFTVQSKKNGALHVTKKGDLLVLDFPKDSLSKSRDNELVENVIDIKPTELYRGRDDLLAIVDSEDLVQNLNINFELLNNIKARGLIVSSIGKNCDFVSRFFAPSAGVSEDPVTGSAHTSLIPYWSKKLKKSKLLAHQISQRGGVLFCEDLGDRVDIGGKAIEYMKGDINI